MGVPGRGLSQSRTAFSTTSLASTLTLAPANRHHPPAAPPLVAAPVDISDTVVLHAAGDPRADSLLDVLRAVKLGVSSLNELFRRMVQYAGVHCVLIDGYSKGVGYVPGVNLKANRTFRNQWTAVYVGKQWRFCNAAWGA